MKDKLYNLAVIKKHWYGKRLSYTYGPYTYDVAKRIKGERDAINSHNNRKEEVIVADNRAYARLEVEDRNRKMELALYVASSLTAIIVIAAMLGGMTVCCS